MLGKTVAVLALAASCVITGIEPAIASSTASQAVSENSPWYATDYGASLSRANPSEQVLTPAAVPNVTYLRSTTSPPTPPGQQCGPEGIAAPALVGGYVYAMTNYALSKYNAATGKLVWRHTPDSTFFTEYQSMSVSSSGTVVVGGSLCDSASEPSSGFYAYNAATGKHLWSVDPSEGLSQAVVSNGSVVTAGSDAAGYFLYVLNLSNGTTVWHNTTSCYPYLTSPLVVSSLVMSYGCDSTGANLTIEARNLSTGALVWSQPGNWTLQRGNSSVNQLFATDPAGAVVALNPLTGKVEYTLSKAVNVLAVDTSRVYATCGSQSVCAYNVKTGAPEWTDASLTATPALAAEADGVLYLNSGLVLNAATGQAITTLHSPNFNAPATALAVGDGRIAVVSNPSKLDLLGLPGY
ncbi:MAG TPA: PQQ-binding-like beta-propeller repeat protein [Streptosporangiaceae bacterium]|nr:PQQ-binding-like beta-propeller repeat protein [Streptosporangiaceae bacterium]